MDKARAFDSVGGPELLDAIVEFIIAYRACEWPVADIQEAVRAAFPIASGGDYAVALVRANRREAAR